MQIDLSEVAPSANESSERPGVYSDPLLIVIPNHTAKDSLIACTAKD